MANGFLLLRFWHPTRDLSYFSSLLSMPCFRSWKEGTPRQTPIGRALTGNYPESYWSSRLEFPCKAGFSENLNFIVDKLVMEEDCIHDLKTSGGKAELYLQFPGSINNGGSIDSSLLKKLGDLGVDLLFEVFPGM